MWLTCSWPGLSRVKKRSVSALPSGQAAAISLGSYSPRVFFLASLEESSDCPSRLGSGVAQSTASCRIPRAAEIAPDTRVLLFTAAISLGVGCLAGLMPAWRASHPNLAGSLNDSSRGSSESGHGIRLRGILVVVEIVLAFVLLSGAGLLRRSFLRLREVSPGFNPKGVMTARFTLPDSRYGKPKQAAEFVRQLMERVKQLPGVSAAAVAWWIPLSGSEIFSTSMSRNVPCRSSATRNLAGQLCHAGLL